MEQSFPALLVVNRHEELDSFIKISLHPVGRAYKHPSLAAVCKMEDTGMLQEAAYNADDLDIFTLSVNTGPQAADTADIELYPHTRL